MKFIHAVVHDIDEFNNYYSTACGWGELTDGDYIVHCLYCEDSEKIIVLEDNTHAPIETIISSFLDGIRFAGGEVTVTKAYIIVDNGLSYNREAVGLCLVEGSYVEVID